MALAKEFYVKNFIFSSSATVYGDPQHLPIDEDHRIIGQPPEQKEGVWRLYSPCTSKPTKP